MTAENPKASVGNAKLPLHLWPETATAFGCLAILDGMLKYGRSNFRAVGTITATTYVDAARRHLAAWMEGEDADPDSGVHHLGHVLASVAIIIEAMVAGNLEDDRNYPTHWRDLVNELTRHVARLKALHADKDPKHFTIADAPASEGTQS